MHKWFTCSHALQAVQFCALRYAIQSMFVSLATCTTNSLKAFLLSGPFNAPTAGTEYAQRTQVNGSQHRRLVMQDSLDIAF